MIEIATTIETMIEIATMTTIVTTKAGKTIDHVVASSTTRGRRKPPLSFFRDAL